MNWIDNTLGIDGRMLLLRAKRAEVIAGNIANADTPGFKARDVNFATALGEAQAMKTTHKGHQGGPEMSASVEYRSHGKVSANGNNVEREFEQSAFARNSMDYLANLRFVDRATRGLIGALRGE